MKVVDVSRHIVDYLHEETDQKVILIILFYRHCVPRESIYLSLRKNKIACRYLDDKVYLVIRVRLVLVT